MPKQRKRDCVTGLAYKQGSLLVLRIICACSWCTNKHLRLKCCAEAKAKAPEAAMQLASLCLAKGGKNCAIARQFLNINSNLLALCCKIQTSAFKRYLSIKQALTFRLIKILFNPIKRKIMGKIEQGILGPFSGTVGTVVGSSWRGVHYMRGKATSRTHTSSEKQVMQRDKFLLMTKFLRQVKSFVDAGFRRLALQKTALNAALSYNLKNGITGIFPAYAIDYSMVLLSRGDLPNATLPTAAADADNKITFTWTDNSGSGKALNTDLVMVAVYCEDLEMSICNTLNPAANRATGTFSVDVSKFAGLTTQTYISFFSENGKEISDSAYTGEVLVLMP
jgi:hypothetical protein